MAKFNQSQDPDPVIDGNLQAGGDDENLDAVPPPLPHIDEEDHEDESVQNDPKPPEQPAVPNQNMFPHRRALITKTGSFASKPEDDAHAFIAAFRRHMRFLALTKEVKAITFPIILHTNYFHKLFMRNQPMEEDNVADFLNGLRPSIRRKAEAVNRVTTTEEMADRDTRTKKVNLVTDGSPAPQGPNENAAFDGQNQPSGSDRRGRGHRRGREEGTNGPGPPDFAAMM